MVKFFQHHAAVTYGTLSAVFFGGFMSTEDIIKAFDTIDVSLPVTAAWWLGWVLLAGSLLFGALCIKACADCYFRPDKHAADSSSESKGLYEDNLFIGNGTAIQTHKPEALHLKGNRFIGNSKGIVTSDSLPIIENERLHKASVEALAAFFANRGKPSAVVVLHVTDGVDQRVGQVIDALRVSGWSVNDSFGVLSSAARGITILSNQANVYFAEILHTAFLSLGMESQIQLDPQSPNDSLHVQLGTT
jgi:hypothetical protein